MKVGDKVDIRLKWVDEEWDGRWKRTQVDRHTAIGTVVYIHPKQRFYRVRFNFPHGSYCECYSMGGEAWDDPYRCSKR